MTDHRAEGPGENGDPIPRDMPDQQADAGEDPWEVAPGLAARGDVEGVGEPGGREAPGGSEDTGDAGAGDRDATGRAGADGPDGEAPDGPDGEAPDGPAGDVPDGPADGVPDGPADDVPDTDEAGTGRQGAPRSGTVHPEHPVPDEPSG